MEEILKEILKELRYHTQLMENIYEKKDEHQAGAAIVKKQMESFKKIILDIPGINPEMVKTMNSIFNTMPGGDE